MKLTNHLVFPGTCEEALLFYKETFKGEIDFLFRKKDIKEAVIDEAEKEKISHMVVKTSGFEIAGEDTDQSETVIAGNNQKLVVKFDDPAECCRVFNCLTEKGMVTMPFQKTFFCDGIGEVTDQYGMNWIIMMDDEGFQA